MDQPATAVPGLGGLRLLEDYLDGALARDAERPGWAGVTAPQRRLAAAPAPAHWRGAADPRGDLMAA